MSWCTPLAASKLSAVQFPFVVKLLDILPPLLPGRLSLLASLSLAHASSAEPKVEAEVESAVRARRYAFAVERSSE